ncbi:MAG: UDP-glucose/GDP-mannose dehydrogenase family protein [Xanthobacteraceae bacterium]|nr:UDP-glucose/GDP-mannose dehydrogenase family protein [Xanthobacteraceae bacterium]
MTKVAVFGLWHLGSVTSACMAAMGHDVVGVDPNAGTITDLANGTPPISEPGLPELVGEGIAAGRLRFSTDPAVLGEADIVWVTFDTPVDENDVADVGFVTNHARAALPHLARGALVLVASQVPVGTTRALAGHAREIGRADLSFGCAPENLRLGSAINVFMRPDRVVVGLEREADRAQVEALLVPLAAPIEFMSIESAEVTKHAINAFLATSVAYANEIAAICEATGADAREVTRGLKSEARIGPRAYVAPGSAFAGGTLARDIAFLSQIGERSGIDLRLLPSVATSNQAHKSWALRNLRQLLGSVEGRRIAVLGLTYKPGTDTLRRSSAVELTRELIGAGADVVAYDPAVKALPAEFGLHIDLATSLVQAVSGTDAVVIATAWPDFLHADWTALLPTMRRQVVLDPHGAVMNLVERVVGVSYVRVGYRSGDRN